MHARRDAAGRGPLELQALYSIAALARVCNVSPQLLGRVLRANRIELLPVGRALLVPLAEIEVKLPLLWRSILSAEAARAGLT
jgi:hypothetical protein